MIQAKHHMSCGCVLETAKLVVRDKTLCCPEHLAGIEFSYKACRRCGDILKIHTMTHPVVYCEACAREMANARTLHSQHQAETFLDPLLWRKSIDTVLEDINTNILLGYEAIQVDMPAKSLGMFKPALIDLDDKIQQLKTVAASQPRTCHLANPQPV